MKMEEVLVVKTSLLADILQEKGLITGKNEAFLEIARHQHCFLPRPAAEQDPSYKQIIPYVLLLRGEEIFTMRRLAKGGESRLHGLISLGVGGHINPVDGCTGADVLMEGMRREIREEVSIQGEGPLTPMGLINDDTNEVGSVHLGLVFAMTVSGDAQVLETEKLEGSWMPIKEAKVRLAEMESWSAIALEAFPG